MKRMMKNPVLHALFWILTYVVTVNIGDFLSEILELPYITAILVILLSIVLVIYLFISKTKLTNRTNDKISFKHIIMIYLPLIAIGCSQLYKGVDKTIDNVSLITIIVLMIGVGFTEEVVFRGLLLKGIQEKSNVKRSIIISGVTFGIGHIVNLARGYGYDELITQIVVAIVIGIVLSMIVVLTNRILPGIIFHILFNVTGSVTVEDSTKEFYVLIAIIVICIPLSLFLYQQIKVKLSKEEKSEVLKCMESTN